LNEENKQMKLKADGESTQQTIGVDAASQAGIASLL
jgi:hypothetical protein